MKHIFTEVKDIVTAESLDTIFFPEFRRRLNEARKIYPQPLDVFDKIVLAHMEADTPKAFLDVEGNKIVRGESTIAVYPDQVALQEATAPMAMLQVMLLDKQAVVAGRFFCDHLAEACKGVKVDLPNAIRQNSEVYNVLAQLAQRYGLGFWQVASGIIHQVMSEVHNFPGSLVIGTDSHTPNGGGDGEVAIGVGGSDACDVFMGLSYQFKVPQRLYIRISGSLPSWTSAKDVVLRELKVFTVNGGTDFVIVYVGEGAKRLTAAQKRTICNMGAESGALTSIFPSDNEILKYLEQTERGEIADVVRTNMDLVTSDDAIEERPKELSEKFYDFELKKLVPLVSRDHSPDSVVTLKYASMDTKDDRNLLDEVVTGSCTNSSLEDFMNGAELLTEAKKKGIKKLAIPLSIACGSQTIYDELERNGALDIYRGFNVTIFINACGPCIGKWVRNLANHLMTALGKKIVNRIMTSFNRNFRNRNDGRPGTENVITGVVIAVLCALVGKISDPRKPVRIGEKSFQFTPPNWKQEKGIKINKQGYTAPNPQKLMQQEVIIDPKSERWQVLKPFIAATKLALQKMPVLMVAGLPPTEKQAKDMDEKERKAFTKCTTDHISPAGPWLKFRGHLERISDNMFSGVVNYWTSVADDTINLFTGVRGNFSAVAKEYKKLEKWWVAIGGENYGEGSSREHAAMSPKHRGVGAVIVVSFARLHETNLKKQGVLPLTFVDPEDLNLFNEEGRMVTANYDDIPSNDRVVKCSVYDENETLIKEFKAKHTMSEQEREFFYAGSSMNYYKDHGVN